MYLIDSVPTAAGEALIQVRWTDGHFVAVAEDFPDCIGYGPNAMDAIRSLRSIIATRADVEVAA